MKQLNILWAFALVLFGSCTTISRSTSELRRSMVPEIDFNRGVIQVELGSEKSWALTEVWPDSASESQINEIFSMFIREKTEVRRGDARIRAAVPREFRAFHLSSVLRKDGQTFAFYSLDTAGIKNWIHEQFYKGDLYFSTELFTQDSMPVYELLLPVDSVPVPDDPLFLPNSDRSYRNGTHRGIDFQVNWGTPFRSIADGVVVRADHKFKEHAPEQWSSWATDAAVVGRTPDDLFYNVFMGRALIIDHGFNLFPGYRTISIYAHLSSIEEAILPGTKVSAGQILGISGNSGTLPATKGEQGQAHLHLEVILQGPGGDTYLGKNTGNEDLYPYLSRIFSP